MDWAQKHAGSLGLIVSTVCSPKTLLDGYQNLLGAPEDKLPGLQASAFMLEGIKFGGSLIGAPWQMGQMLALVAVKTTKPWVNTRPLKEADQAILDFEDGKPSYRFVLLNQEHVKA